MTNISLNDYSIVKKICKNNFYIDVGSNYVKHNNFVVIEENLYVYKIYNSIEKFYECVYKFDWAKKNVTEFIVPQIEDAFIFQNKGIIKFAYIEKEKNNNLIQMIDSFFNLFNKVKTLGKNVTPDFTKEYELKHQYENIFENNDFVLTHGDLNHKNIFKTKNDSIAVIDWDNLSFQPQNLVEHTTALYFLSHPYFHSDRFFEYFLVVLRKFKNVEIYKLIELSEEKYKLSVSTVSKDYWKMMAKKLELLYKEIK